METLLLRAMGCVTRFTCLCRAAGGIGAPLFLCAAMASGLTLSVSAASQSGIVWWEAESFRESNWPGGRSGEGPFAPRNDVQREVISGGAWLNAMGFPGMSNQAPFVAYDVEVPGDGDYTLWIRLFGRFDNGVRSAFRYRFDGRDWVEQGQGSGTTLHKVKPQSNSTLAWVRFGKVRLAAGRHDFRLEALDLKDVSGFDCFVLAVGSFQPNGPLKPGEKTGQAMDGWWAFEPDHDRFSPEAMLDLSSLNHTPAGRYGYVTRSADGNDFMLDGKPIRFWSVEVDTGKMELEDLEYQARFLAKRGVNAVRFFECVEPKAPESKVTDIDEEAVQHAWKIVAAMKKYGLYVMITPFWTYELKVQRGWGLPYHRPPPGPPVSKPDGAFFVEPALREAYKGWMRKFLLTPNPYTGVPLARDPAVYCIQVHNEQSYFFYTYLQGCRPGALREFGKRFGDWLTRKYGSLDQAVAAWGGRARVEASFDLYPGDDFTNGIVGLPAHLYSLSADYTAGRRRNASVSPGDRRAEDYLQFLAEHMRAVYEEMSDFYHKELGYRGLASACNWKTRDPITLLDAERWAYTAGDVMDRHCYVDGGPHINPTHPDQAGYTISVGDYFGDTSALFDPRRFPTVFKMPEGFPCMVSESTWVSPMSYQAEGPLLVACYGRLTGLDMFTWFSTSALDWDTSMAKFPVSVPALQGQFPACALIYRQGLVKEAKPAVYTERRLSDIWSLHFPLITEDPGYDPNVNASYIDEKVAIPGGAAPLAYLVGPVRCRYGGDPAKSGVADLAPYLDPERRTVRSLTGELRTDYSNGLFTVDAACAQGAAGFLARAGRITLSDVEVVSSDEYAAVVVVSLNAAPIASSRKVLVQVGAPNRPYGWEEKPATFDVNLGQKNAKPLMVAGKQIVALGRPPWNVRKTAIAVTIRNPGLTHATRLDANGMPCGPVSCKGGEGGLTVQLPPDALYVVLQ